MTEELKAQSGGVSRPFLSRRLLAWQSLGLGLAVLAVYAGTYSNGFISIDDSGAVYANPVVMHGLTGNGLLWAFLTFDTGNWIPLTWLSHMIDCQVFGLNPGPQHLVNAGFHLANAVLLFLAFARMTGRPWRSLLVAGIFALHPLHVESAAWIAERKDVLSTFFLTLVLLLYPGCVEAPTARRRAALTTVFVLGLMAKSMLITLPFVLLLLDLWPLRRLALPERWPSAGDPFWPALLKLVKEKELLLAIAAGFAVIGYIAARSIGTIQSSEAVPLPLRLANAVAAYAGYLRKSVWPSDLAIYYPYRAIPAADVVADLAVLLSLTIAALVCARRRPYLLAGWLWYLGVLVPVIGFVQAGFQAMADHYTYVSLIGPSFAAVWAVADLLETRKAPTYAGAALGAAMLALLGLVSYQQLAYWKDSGTMYRRTLVLTQDNYTIHNYLGMTFSDEGKFAQAEEQFEAAIAVNPDFSWARFNLGMSLAAEGRHVESVAAFEAVLRADPAQAGVQTNLCAELYALGRFAEAADHCREALRLAPGMTNARFNLDLALARLRASGDSGSGTKQKKLHAKED